MPDNKLPPQIPGDRTMAAAGLPSVDSVTVRPSVMALSAHYGRQSVVKIVQTVLSDWRERLRTEPAFVMPDEVTLLDLLSRRLAARQAIGLKPVFNLTGTVLHTNLGRAPLAAEAIQAMVAAAGAASVEFDLAKGKRGERDAHVERWLCELTGAEAALVVNNNAAAVLLTLNALANRREVPVSRGELVEIGGAFRVPDIMARAGAKLVEVGTTNRTHLRDYADAIGPETALVMKVHPSNYAIHGFTAEANPRELAKLCHEHGLPFVDDLGSGALIDMTTLGLPAERTPMQALADGADVVTFSGDKLLGGPQSGLVVGRKDLIEKLRKSPLKRTMRLDKVMLAALEATLILHDDPKRAAERIPSLRMLARPAAEIAVLAERLASDLAKAVGGDFTVSVEPCRSQIGSGALPVDLLESAALVARPVAAKGKGRALNTLAAALRALPMPVLGRVADDALWLDLRCLEDEAGFAAQIAELKV
jgi:L-seryl-tRNA(Ser) seleniumtransferase